MYSVSTYLAACMTPLSSRNFNVDAVRKLISLSDYRLYQPHIALSAYENRALLTALEHPAFPDWA